MTIYERLLCKIESIKLYHVYTCTYNHIHFYPIFITAYGVVSALMHYFFLDVFFWMAAVAIELHRKLVSVFKPDIENYVFSAMATCWGKLV